MEMVFFSHMLNITSDVAFFYVLLCKFVKLCTEKLNSSRIWECGGTVLKARYNILCEILWIENCSIVQYNTIQCNNKFPHSKTGRCTFVSILSWCKSWGWSSFQTYIVGVEMWNTSWVFTNMSHISKGMSRILLWPVEAIARLAYPDQESTQQVLWGPGWPVAISYTKPLSRHSLYRCN